jgi:hypothetical protein
MHQSANGLSCRTAHQKPTRAPGYRKVANTINIRLRGCPLQTLRDLQRPQDDAPAFGVEQCDIRPEPVEQLALLRPKGRVPIICAHLRTFAVVALFWLRRTPVQWVKEWHRATPSPLSQWGQFPIFTGMRLSRSGRPHPRCRVRGKRAGSFSCRACLNSSKSSPDLSGQVAPASR